MSYSYSYSMLKTNLIIRQSQARVYLGGILKKVAQQNQNQKPFLAFLAQKANFLPKGEVDLGMYVLPRQL